MSLSKTMLLLFSCLSSFAAEICATKMEIIQEKGERVTHLSEGLMILDGKTQIRAKSGFFFPTRNLLLLLDSIVIKGEEGELKSDSAVYFLGSKESELFKRVELDLETLKILTNHLKWDGKKKEARGEEVLIIFKGRDVEITGKDGVYSLEKKIGEIKKEPLLILKGEETTRITAEMFIYDGRQGRLFTYGDSRVTQKNRILRCDTLVYFLEGDSGIAGGGKPHLVGEDGEIRGREFRFFAEKDEVKEMKVLGEVAAVYNRSDERVEIGGENLVAYLSDGKVVEMAFEGITYGRMIRKK